MKENTPRFESCDNQKHHSKPHWHVVLADGESICCFSQAAGNEYLALAKDVSDADRTRVVAQIAASGAPEAWTNDDRDEMRRYGMRQRMSIGLLPYSPEDMGW